MVTSDATGRTDEMFCAFVSCPTDGLDVRVPLTAVQVTYLNPGRTPHAVFCCPACAGQHQVPASLDVLDTMRAAGAASDWPQVPADVSALTG